MNYNPNRNAANRSRFQVGQRVRLVSCQDPYTSKWHTHTLWPTPRNPEQRGGRSGAPFPSYPTAKPRSGRRHIGFPSAA